MNSTARARAFLSECGLDTPFPWQIALLERLLAGDIPGALDIPTGLGKTSVMALWLAARAAGAQLPRRLVYVVDRRAIVDQATTEAERLRERVDASPRLRKALGLEGRLAISTLRGQYADNREWHSDPSAPAIILGTVDMVGSRLLFEGYAASRKMRPYYAGLLGVDALVALDEAHLVPPFHRLVTAIEARQRAEAPRAEALGPASDRARGVVPPLRVIALSATGAPDPNALALAGEDHRDPVELPDSGGGTRDASPGAFIALRARAEADPALRARFEAESTPAPLHPPLTRALVEAWSMTSLETHAGRPEVEPWLRGWIEREPETTLVWRDQLPLDAAGQLLAADALESFTEAAGPYWLERLELGGGLFAAE